ncbi:hypothetical protein [Spirosoma foliorum]|uniref:Uncharacterized protein n=1 Tax=Spirosoma foliorum TaxID=2710596 RepID=A0A7G5H6M9_9BACT|nr:hypothetical protein [Spirosoma foliorum]QMW06771.1 hypothetical protein H3H32_18695 [Spirosoma foliorum]
MDTELIKQKIIAETTALMPLKVDNEDVVLYKFRHIQSLVIDLTGSVAGESEPYSKAFTLMQSAINEEYKQFSESVSYEEKEQALILLKHKAAEVCELLQAG